MWFFFSGNVVAPLLNLDQESINFGVVAFGYRYSKKISLCNTSPIPIPYSIEISENGSQLPIDCSDFLNNKSIPSDPQELWFNKPEGVVPSETTAIETLSVLSNTKGIRHLTFTLHMWNSKNHYFSIPLLYDCQVAQLKCIPAKIDIKFCFINYSYDKTLTLKNCSNLPCCFQLVELTVSILISFSINFSLFFSLTRS